VFNIPAAASNATALYMWRSNVLRLRKCSSAGGLRHGVARRLYSSEKSLPITDEEFHDALGSVLAERRAREGSNLTGAGVNKVPIGMWHALIQVEELSLTIGLRPGYKWWCGFYGACIPLCPSSRREHLLVDMQASVLTLTLPEDFDMTDQKRFETEARTRRYQALGRACREHRLNALMLAHHGDDQAETVLMRLANKRVRTGLKAMQSVEWIPECEGIYGVHHSGVWVKNDSAQPRKSWRPPFPVEQGGVQILRPLLAMEKSRLVATCEEHGVQWAEDKSNNDRTLTSRNAIRHMYNHHQMPKALSIPSLVNVSMNMQKRVAEHQSYAKGLYDQCLIKLNIQTGSLIIRFPPFSSLLPRPIQTGSDQAEARNNAYYLLEQVADLVTPQLKAATGQLDARVNSIYPEFLFSGDREETAGAGLDDLKQNFTVGKIWWRKLDTASPFDDNGLPSVDHQAAKPHPREWRLSRQTFEDHDREKVYHIVPPSSGLRVQSEPGAEDETFQLFDGRFWIQLTNHTHDNLILRPFTTSDMRHLPTTQMNRQAMRSRSGPIPERFITAAFATIKPSDVRYTLPAVFRKDIVTGEEILIGFPTLNVRMGGIGPPLEICEWQVRYKKIDLGSHSPEDMIAGLRNDDIVQLEKKDRMASKGIKRLSLGNLRGGLPYRSLKRDNNNSRGDEVKNVQRTMERDESDGFDFLQKESEKQEEGKGRAKGAEERRKMQSLTMRRVRDL
jgi:tRNA(Ile)-lysidine synthase